MESSSPYSPVTLISTTRRISSSSWAIITPPLTTSSCGGFFLQNGDNYFGSWFWSNSVDVMVLASQYLLAERPLMPNFKLSTVAAQLGVSVSEDKLHDALYDVDLTRDAYHIMIDGCDE